MKLKWEDGKGGKEITEGEMVELLKRGEVIVAELKNGVGYVLTSDMIGNPFLSIISLS